MQKIAEYKSNNLIFNHLVYDKEKERHFAKHSHSMFELIYIIKGEVTYTIEDSRFIAKRGELIVIKPYTYHYFTIKNRQDYEKIGILFTLDNSDVAEFMPNAFSLLNCSYGRVNEIFNKLDFYYNNCPSPLFEELLSMLVKEITINLKYFTGQDTVKSPTESIHPLIKRAVDYINENLFSINTVKELAEQLSVSESHLKVLFKSQLKVTPKTYITEKKMLLAHSMIIGGTPPTQAAISCGYSNYVTFYRIYLNHFKTRPSDDYKQ